MIKRWWPVFILSAWIAPFLGVFLVTAAGYFQPALYESVWVIRLAPEQMKPSLTQAGSTREFGKFLDEQVSMLTARDPLLGVCRKLRFPQRWRVGEEEALSRLREKVEVQRIGGNLLRIRVVAERTDQADLMVQALFEAYAGPWRNKPAGGSAKPAVLPLLKQEEKVEALKHRLEGLRNSLNPLSLAAGAEDFAAQSPVYRETKRELDAEEALLGAMTREFQPEDGQKSRAGDPVAIHDKPVPTARRIESNDSRRRLAGGGIGLLVSPLLAWMIIPVLRRMEQRPAIPPLNLDPERF